MDDLLIGHENFIEILIYTYTDYHVFYLICCITSKSRGFAKMNSNEITLITFISI